VGRGRGKVAGTPKPSPAPRGRGKGRGKVVAEAVAPAAVAAVPVDQGLIFQQMQAMQLQMQELMARMQAGAPVAPVVPVVPPAQVEVEDVAAQQEADLEGEGPAELPGAALRDSGSEGGAQEIVGEDLGGQVLPEAVPAAEAVVAEGEGEDAEGSHLQ
jgi:hypothetical protein